MNCPKCTSTNIGSNKLDPVIFERVTHAGRFARQAGHPHLAVGAVVAWGGLHLVNACREKWVCADCGHKFS